MNKIQSKDHRVGTYEIKKNSLSCFDDNYISETMDIWISSRTLELIIKNSYQFRKTSLSSILF